MTKQERRLWIKTIRYECPGPDSGLGVKANRRYAKANAAYADEVVRQFRKAKSK